MINLGSIKSLKSSFIGDFFYSEHFDAAIEILSIMASTEPNTNHIILDAPTQSGKTSVMEMVYRILNYKELYRKYKIDNVIYLTADNGSGNGSLKMQTKDRFEKHWKKYTHSLPINFLKRSDLKNYEDELENTLLIVDETQYGWREIESMCQRFLQKNGVNFTAGACLCENNTFILSVSATTQNERYGDRELQLKPIVYLKTGKGYIGFKDFLEMGVVKPLTKENFIDDYEKLDNFLSEQRKKLKKIYKETRIAKCIIIRLFDNKKTNFVTDSEEFEEVVDNNGFTFQVITCKDSKIDYTSLQHDIYWYCDNYKDNGSKFHIIFIKNAFSYGITIDKKIKKLIGTCYDVRKDANSTEATEQGLLGRMSGYGCTKSDFEGLEIFVNEFHLNGIKANVVYGNNPYSMPLKKNFLEKIVECDKKEWNGEEENISIFFDKKNIYEGEDIDFFFKKHKEFDYKSLFSSEPLKVTQSVLKPIIIAFCEEFGIKCSYVLDSRKIKDRRGKILDFFNNGRLGISKAKRASKMLERLADEKENGIIFYVDIREANKKTKNGIKIFFKQGHFGYSKIEDSEVFKANKSKYFKGYDTSINGQKIAPIFI